MYLQAQLSQAFGHQGRGSLLLKRQVGMGMNIAAGSDKFLVISYDVG